MRISRRQEAQYTVEAAETDSSDWLHEVRLRLHTPAYLVACVEIYDYRHNPVEDTYYSDRELFP